MTAADCCRHKDYKWSHGCSGGGGFSPNAFGYSPELAFARELLRPRHQPALQRVVSWRSLGNVRRRQLASHHSRRAHAPFTRAWYPAACQGEWFGGRPCALPAARDADAVAAAELRQEELAESPVHLTPSAASSHRRPTGLAAVWTGPARPHTLGENALRVLSAWPVGVTPLNCLAIAVCRLAKAPAEPPQRQAQQVLVLAAAQCAPQRPCSPRWVY